MEPRPAEPRPVEPRLAELGSVEPRLAKLGLAERPPAERPPAERPPAELGRWKSDMVGIRAGGDYGQMAAVGFTANVTKASDLAIEPKTPQSFVGILEATSPPVVFTVTNLSNTTSGTIVSAIVGESVRDFKITETDCTILAPHTSCTVSVVCSPPMSASAATREAVLSVTDGNTHLSVPLSAEVSF